MRMDGKRALRPVGVLILAALMVHGVGRGAETPKNLIVLIADGADGQEYTFARWWRGAPLAVEEHLAGAVRTRIADSVVADSAPAATGFATGVASGDKSIGVGPAAKGLLPYASLPGGIEMRPLATVLEGARLAGKATGVVATSAVSHATPAAYYAHTPDRGDEESILEMGVYGQLDVALGGGARLLRPDGVDGGRRRDGEDLAAVLRSRGYHLPATAAELEKIESGRVWGLFAGSGLTPVIDRPADSEQPTLAGMTRKALELLSADPEGFFLVVEGSQVDWAGHANDPAYMIHELLAWDEACRAALDFAKADGRTLVLMFSDHATGGFTVGNRRSDGSYSGMSPEALVGPIRRVGQSTGRMARHLGGSRRIRDVKRVAREGWGVNLEDGAARRVLELIGVYGDADRALAEVLSAEHSFIGWTTHGHVGGDVPLAAFGPGAPRGVFDGDGLGRFCAGVLGLDSAALTRRLFADASEALPGAGIEIVAAKTIEGEGGRTGAETLVVERTARIAYDGRVAELPVNKNLLRLDGREVELEGVVVYIEATGRLYVPEQAVRLIEGRR